MDSPLSSRPLHSQFIWPGIIGVVVSLIWLQIHVDQTVTGFENVFRESTRMEDLHPKLSATLGDLVTVPVGVYIIGNLGLVSIVTGIWLFYRRKTKHDHEGRIG